MFFIDNYKYFIYLRIYKENNKYKTVFTILFCKFLSIREIKGGNFVIINKWLI